MVDLSGMGSGDFLNAKDMRVGDRIRVLVTGEGKMQPADGEYKAALLLEVKYDNKPKTLRLGTKNVAAIIAKLGNDSKSWVGKELDFIVYQTNYQNKLGFQYIPGV